MTAALPIQALQAQHLARQAAERGSGGRRRGALLRRLDDLPALLGTVRHAPQYHTRPQARTCRKRNAQSAPRAATSARKRSPRAS